MHSPPVVVLLKKEREDSPDRPELASQRSQTARADRGRQTEPDREIPSQTGRTAGGLGRPAVTGGTLGVLWSTLGVPRDGNLVLRAEVARERREAPRASCKAVRGSRTGSTRGRERMIDSVIFCRKKPTQFCHLWGPLGPRVDLLGLLVSPGN